ncbi:MAG TPA: fatty acid CoA ligase family protein [Pirellulales bacterium]|jgi:acyl-CoA synthetase (AMP-forming)/AMP-acid ligase II|nr:fatty acid CoA ligase family protein [Pirellulales bacterium]
MTAGLAVGATASLPPTVNVARRLSAMAELQPDVVAVAAPRGKNPLGRQDYDQLTFRQLDQDSNRIASGLARLGVVPATRLALLVRPGIDFISLVFGLLKAGAVAILIDPGMGRRNLVACLAAVEPEGFVAIPAAQAVRRLLAHRFPKARFNVTVGRRLFWGGTTLAALRASGQDHFQPVATRAEDPAAIIFTTGSTGPPKGVLYCHGNFEAQVEQLGQAFGIAPGEVDLAGFPLFGLFNGALGVTTVVPVMDPTRPAKVVPKKLLAAIRDWRVTQSFGSPAIWNRVGLDCQKTGARIEWLRRVISAGAPVPAHVLARMKSCLPPDAEIHTPYGATEALPVATITASEILAETQAQTRRGAGVCVGRRFSGIRWQVVRIVDGPIATLADAEPLPAGEIGELIVTGPVVTREYVTRREWNALAKIADGSDVWHRMGDAGYLDDRERFWFCGRVAHRVLSAAGPMFTSPCEEIFNQHPAVYRSALVGIGPVDRQRPAIVVECWPDRRPRSAAARRTLLSELRELALSSPLTHAIDQFLIHRSMPVDIRHNAKIFREQLAVWAAARLDPIGPS